MQSLARRSSWCPLQGLGRMRPLRIRDLDGDLLAPDRQIPTGALCAAFDHAPLWTKPLDKRIVAAIVGVPCA